MYLELQSSSFLFSLRNMMYFYPESNLVFLLEFWGGYFTYGSTESGHCSQLQECEFAVDLN